MSAAPAPALSGSVPKLYPPQSEGVLRFLTSAGTTVPLDGPHRFIFGWATGCGKTAGALRSCQSIAAGYMKVRETDRPPPVLVVTPAVVRRHWLREVAVWSPSYIGECAAIEYGRNRALSEKEGKQRSWAYRQLLQVVSYDLLKEVNATGWHTIILDELHHVAQPLSKQSKLVRSLLAANPKAHVLGLTATPFPTEVKQLWNPLRLLYGEAEWGKPSRTGDVSWDFAKRYCHIVKNEYGTTVSGCRPERREELRERLAKRIHFLTREDLRDDLPPLDVHLLELTCDIDRTNEAISNWAQDKVSEGVKRTVVLTQYRKDARELFAMLSCAYPKGVALQYIDGTIESGARDTALQWVSTVDSPAILVGTHGALSEGVRLMWAEEVLIKEWSRSPGRLVQLLGRFQSVGSSAKPHVSLLSGGEQWGAGITLLERVRTMLAVTGESPSAAKLEELLAAPQSEDVASLLHDMLSEIRDTETWTEDAP